VVAVIVVKRELDFATHSCGAPWYAIVRGEREFMIQVAARWGIDVAEYLAPVMVRRWVYPQAWICAACDELVLWNHGTHGATAASRHVARTNALIAEREPAGI
jgi:hypothetical protein